jgi:hypothetical protein
VPQGITEGDIANYLANTPGFFERHAELLASVQLTSPHGQRAVSLQERQMEMLRERIKLPGAQDRRDDPQRPGERGHRRPPAPLDPRLCWWRDARDAAGGAGARAAA